MAPTSCRSWMSTHRSLYGDLPVSDLCLPASHDAGTYQRMFGTLFGTSDNVVTQTRSIFDQLELGVRHFDIRASFAAPEESDTFTWNCGHYTDVGHNLGWQGGSCVPIQQVVDDLNRFTKDNAELVILKVKNIERVRIKNGSHSIRDFPSAEEYRALLKMLSGIDNLFTLQRAAGNKDKPFQDYHLNDFIGANQAAVVVIVQYGDTPDELFQHDLWPEHTAKGNETYGAANWQWLTPAQSDLQAVLSSLSPYVDLFTFLVFHNRSFADNKNSVLNINIRKQKEEFPWLLQKIAAEGVGGVIVMDRIENTDLLSFCLAVTYQRYNNNQSLNNKVIVYGGQLITDPEVHNEIQNAIDNARSFRVDNGSLRADPWIGMIKSCAVFYKQDGLLKGRWAREGDLLHFELDVLSIKYGPQDLRNQTTYASLLRCIGEESKFEINNKNLGDIDPQPGVRKDFAIRWRSMDETKIREKKSQEYKTIDF